MAWFKHKHWWRDRSGIIVIKRDDGSHQGGMQVEDCTCGAVRTVEFYPGQPPVVRIALKPEDK